VVLKSADFVLITDIALTESGMSLPCHLLVRYLDPRWKRYGYPFLAGDLNVRLDDAYCERSSIHRDNVHAFVSRLLRYVPTIEADASVSVLPVGSSGSASPSPYVNHQQRANQPPVVTYQQPRPEYTQALSPPAVQYNSAIPGQRIQKSKGCGCRKG
jgi:hypothetical protein